MCLWLLLLDLCSYEFGGECHRLGKTSVNAFVCIPCSDAVFGIGSCQVEQAGDDVPRDVDSLK